MHPKSDGSRPQHDAAMRMFSTCQWLVATALSGVSLEKIFSDCCRRLCSAGIPLSRAHASFTTLHPLYGASALTWHRDADLRQASYGHAMIASDAWMQSPLNHLIQSRLPQLRRRLTGPQAVRDFPVLEELSAEGATDYLAFAAPFGAYFQGGATAEQGMVGSWATDAAGGFSDSQLCDLEVLQPSLVAAFGLAIKSQIARNVVTTYLGRGAGEKVLAGQIQRGDGERIRAVIWYSDMRRSTALADQLDDARFLQALNDYFECTAGAVSEYGGEVLRFVGDAVLAIFSVGALGEPGEACRSAARAARLATDRLSETNARRAASGQPTLDFGVGLHLGHVLFGNIGIPDRLEFTVVGPTANEVARIEELTKALGRRVVASENVASRLPAGQWEEMGQHCLRGIGTPCALYAMVNT